MEPHKAIHNWDGLWYQVLSCLSNATLYLRIHVGSTVTYLHVTVMSCHMDVTVMSCHMHVIVMSCHMDVTVMSCHF